MKLQAAIRWYMERLDIPPSKLHVRAVWADYSDPRPRDFPDVPPADLKGGSHLGTRAFSREFAQWLEHAAATTTERWAERCSHPGLTDADRRAGAVCTACCRWKDQRPDYETGWVERSRVRYRWPMQAALAALSRSAVRPGRPDPALVLLRLAMADGDLERVASAFAGRYPTMGDVRVTAGYVAWALARVRSLYRDEPPPRTIDRSQAQIDAEAAALPSQGAVG